AADRASRAVHVLEELAAGRRVLLAPWRQVKIAGAICCDCCATAYHDLVIGWTSSTQNELVLLSSRLCAAKRRAGICRPMQVTVRIRASTARDEQDWQGH